MAQGSTNRVEWLLNAESTFGVAPGGTYDTLRFLSDDLKPNIDVIASDEIREDLRVPDQIPTAFSSGGNFAYELSHGTYDKIFTAAMGASSVLSTARTVSGTPTLTFDVTSNVSEITRSTGSFITDGFLAGQVCRITGTSRTNIDGYAKILTVAATRLTVAVPQIFTNTAVAVPTAQVTMLPQAVDGTTFTAYHMQRQWKDLTSKFSRFPATTWTGFNVNSETRGIVGGSFTAFGRYEVSATASDAASTNAASTTKAYGATPHLKAFVVGSGDQAVAGEKVRLLNFGLTYNIRNFAQDEQGVIGPTSICLGGKEISGFYEGYFEEHLLYDRALNRTDDKLFIAWEDAAGNGTGFILPRITYTEPQRVVGGKDQPAIFRLGFVCSNDATEDGMIKYFRT